MSDTEEEELKAEFDEAVFGLVAKGYVEIVPGVDGGARFV